MSKAENSRYLPVVAGCFVAALLITNVTNAKFVSLGPFVMTGGTLLFPIAFIFNDILTEVYGYAKTRVVIWMGVGCQLFGGLFYWLVGLLPSAAFWAHQDAYDVILSISPRLAVASVVAYLCGEFANSIVLSRMKYRDAGARGAKQGWRFIASTIVGEGVDSIVFILIAFAGVMSLSDLFYTTGSIYILKVIYEAAATPLSTRLANWLKEREGVDHMDDPASTNYSPFAVSS